jgi:(2R)-sulfolactate sulfo-lyase subunit beta
VTSEPGLEAVAVAVRDTGPGAASSSMLCVMNTMVCRSRSRRDALAPAERPTRAGLNFMDTSCAAAEFITLTAAAGAVIHLFPTGQGNVVGHPVEPVIKITANPLTQATMSEHIDVDVSGLLQLDYDLAAAGDRLEDVIDRTVNGRLTCAEALGHREFALTRLHPSA